MSTDITSVGGAGDLHPGDTATVQWRDGFTQITGEVVSVERTSPTSWSVRFGGRVPFRVHVAEGEWRFVGAVPRRVTPEERVRAEARTVTTEQLDAAARASWQESWAPFAEAHAGGEVTWEQVAPEAKASWRHDAAAVLRAVGLTVPDGPGTSVGATTEEAP